MKNFSGITDNLDITTKKYVDDGLASKANLAGNNTFTGGQRITGTDGGYSINASGYIKGSWLQSSATSNKGANTGKVCVFDDAGWIYYRTPKEVIIDAECAVKYEAKKNIDFGNSGALCIGKFKVYDTNVTCEITSTTSVTYSGKLVIATQNNVIKQMTVYGDAANTVAPNFFIKPSSASDPYIEVYFKPTSWSKNVVHIYGSAIEAEPTDVCTNVSAVPATATSKPTNALNGKANLLGGNIFKGNQTFVVDDSNSTIETFVVNDSGSGLDVIKVTAGAGLELQDGFTTSGAIDCRQGASVGDSNKFLSLNYSDINRPVLTISDGAVLNLDGDTGQAGQVCTSSGNGTAPTWTTLPITSATLDVANKTLYLTLPSGS
nr:MAG TPA: hypothetical protein [Caudoviricetes sp.]